MIIFDGKKFAAERELVLAKKVLDLHKKGIYPKLAAILIGEDVASVGYVQIKKKAALRVGCEVDDYRVSVYKDYKQALGLIKFLNSDPGIHGIMIQLPLPLLWKKYKSNFFNLISPEKDVDGHRTDSKFLPATVGAIMSILDQARVSRADNIAVVGSKGEVGKRLITHLESEKYKVTGSDKADFKKSFDKNADVIISATGNPDLIDGDMVKKDAVVIDVGYPMGDVNFKQVSKKAKFITPVPGGVGPVTVVSLMENLIEAASVANKANF